MFGNFCKAKIYFHLVDEGCQCSKVLSRFQHISLFLPLTCPTCCCSSNPIYLVALTGPELLSLIV